MLRLDFAKCQALGNDFVVVDQTDKQFELTADHVRRICDRHLGVGADGLVVIRPSRTADFRMVFHNADGSAARMCGNGIRCLGKYVADRGLAKADTVTVETGAGIKTLTLQKSGGKVAGARVDMGVPNFAPADVPVSAGGDEFIDAPIELGKRRLRVTCLSMGNPHCVIFVDDVADAPVGTLGPMIERLAIFPERTNVEFVQMINNGLAKVRIWERGVGETLACGTGACASLVAAVRTGRASRSAKVEVPGGTLDISWERDGHVHMAGPALHVFNGSIDLERGAGPRDTSRRSSC